MWMRVRFGIKNKWTIVDENVTENIDVVLVVTSRLNNETIPVNGSHYRNKRRAVTESAWKMSLRTQMWFQLTVKAIANSSVVDFANKNKRYWKLPEKL